MSSHHGAYGIVLLMEGTVHGVSMLSGAEHTIVPEAVPIGLSLLAGLFTVSRWVDPFFAPAAAEEAAVGDTHAAA